MLSIILYDFDWIGRYVFVLSKSNFQGTISKHWYEGAFHLEDLQDISVKRVKKEEGQQQDKQDDWWSGV